MSELRPLPNAPEGPPAVVPAFTAQRHSSQPYSQPHTPPTQCAAVLVHSPPAQYDVAHSPRTGYYHPENWQPNGQFVPPGPQPGPSPLMQQYPAPPPLIHPGQMYSAVPQPYPATNGIPAPVNCPPPPPPGNWPHGNFPAAPVPYGTYSAPPPPQGSYSVQQSPRGYHSQPSGPAGPPPHNQYATMNGGHRDPAVPRRMPNSAPRRNPLRNGSNQHYKPTSQYLPQNQRAPPPPPSLDDFPPLGATARSNPPPPPQQPLNNPPSQQSDRGRGGRYIPASGNRNTNSNAPVRIAPRYEQFFPIQAQHLDALAKEILEQITPPPGETEQKWKLLAQLEQLCKQVISSARLTPFGSLITGFATASSDIDCIFSPMQVTNNRDVKTPHVIQEPTDAEKERLGDHPDYPLLLAQLLEKNAFQVLLLSKTRVPIIKLKRPASDSNPELACDIGFKNSLAVHNTELLKTYSECDERVKPLVLFIKWWAKKRCINTPYLGTLCSYGYVLMILHYLINVVQPPVLPNLQDIPAPVNTDPSELYYSEDGGNTVYYIWFAKNLSEIPRSKNTSSLGELIRGFFDYYSFKFAWGNAVISIRNKGGLSTKQEKGWTTANIKTAGGEGEKENTFQVKNRYLVAIEDPFEITHNVGRTCTGKGLNTIRSEFRRAMDKIKTVSMTQEFSTGSGIYELCEQAPIPERQPRRPLSMESTGGPAPTVRDSLAETTGSSAESSTDSAPPTPKASHSTTAATTPTELSDTPINDVAKDNVVLACSTLKKSTLQDATINGDLVNATLKLDLRQ